MNIRNKTAAPCFDDGSPWERGQADAFLGKPASPHFFVSSDNPLHPDTVAIQAGSMTENQVAEYNAGYDDQYAYESSDDELLSASYEQDAWNWEEEE